MVKQYRFSEKHDIYRLQTNTDSVLTKCQARYLWTCGDIKYLCISSDSMTLILLQTKSETAPPKDVRGVAFLDEAYASCQIFGIWRNNLFPVAPVALILKLSESQWGDLSDLGFSGYDQINRETQFLAIGPLPLLRFIRNPRCSPILTGKPLWFGLMCHEPIRSISALIKWRPRLYFFTVSLRALKL